MKSTSKIVLYSVTFVMAVGAALTWASRTTAAGQNRNFMIKISKSDYQVHHDEMTRAGIDVAGFDLPNSKVYLVVSDEGRAFLQSKGVSIPNEFAERIPQMAPDSQYKTPEKIAQILHRMETQYPQLATVSSIGKSLEGRDILVMKITSSAAPKPSLLFNSMHHAREVMSPEVSLDTADYLLSNYGKDANVTRWVDNNEIYLVPMLNVDGNNKVWTQDNMWRKNARGRFGVDIERNYPYRWSGCNGSGSSEVAQDYHGPSAASEPETNALMNLATKIHPVFDITYHSFSEVILYPYGCGDHAAQRAVLEPIGKKMASLIASDDGSGTYTAGTPPELLYTVDGDDVDWMYNSFGTFAYVLEMNSGEQGFQPDYNEWRDKTVAAIRPAWQLLLARTDGPSIRGLVKMPDDGSAVTVKFQGQTYPVRTDGVYDLIVNSGEYDLEFFNGAQSMGQKHVVVAAQPVVLDIN